jgi:LysR family transcriptional regulator (chromosome initiation inhibitor)
MGFDRQQLETFAVVVESRHFGHAARSLNITRGAVSQRINALEESLGMPLLMRDGAAPTPAGEALLRHIQVLRALETDRLVSGHRNSQEMNGAYPACSPAPTEK